VSSDPWAFLYIDGTQVGRTPAMQMPIKPGPHTVRLLRDGYEAYEEAINVAAGGQSRLNDIRLKQVTP
jgi:hypothetical protein